MKPLLVLIVGLMVVGCATTATTTKSMAGTYERKGGGNTSTIVFLENGIAEDYTNGRGPQRRAKWRRRNWIVKWNCSAASGPGADGYFPLGFSRS